MDNDRSRIYRSEYKAVGCRFTSWIFEDFLGYTSIELQVFHRVNTSERLLANNAVQLNLVLNTPELLKLLRLFKYADRRRFGAVVVAGGNEISEGQVSVKDLRLGEELSADAEVSDRRAWLEALPGQVTVAEGDLVATVQEILGRYDQA